jgi:hypothetical protein
VVIDTVLLSLKGYGLVNAVGDAGLSSEGTVAGDGPFNIVLPSYDRPAGAPTTENGESMFNRQREA